ncbi:MAG: metallophosphoesterase [Candidatus Nanoarchaeia archaeon]
MEKETKYGVISDVHDDPRIVPITIEVLKNLGAQKLLVNGDIGNRQETLKDSQDYIAYILNAVAKSGMESFVQPGSHESLLAYGPVIEHFSGKYSNLIDATKVQKKEQNGHDLVFLPGSDFLCGGEYQIGNSKLQSSRYLQTKEELVQFEKFGEYIDALNNGIASGAIQYFNMQDLRKLITAPEKTIVVSHVPRKFDNLENCVDVAEFGEATRDFIIEGHEVQKGAVYPMQIACKIAKAGYPVEIKKENRGNKDLRDLYEELGVRKAVSGHFHESSHRANDRQGNKVRAGEFVDELFWNSGHLSAGYTGILTVQGEKVSYRNVNLGEYLK